MLPDEFCCLASSINIDAGFGIGLLNLLASLGKNAAIFLLFGQPPLEVPPLARG